ncbi:MAG TPA: type II toxin-antitoxin system Phd/YefM family antitoxin [Caulobacteraceae bacterium]|nr:type II toxin-antitoxin system Phd/YefM family antitoxin [Caulobacteraceae bacterium]
MNWTLASAKDHLSEVVRRASTVGPQTISVRGEDAAVLLSKADFDRLVDPDRPKTIKDWLLNGPKLEGVEFERAEGGHRDVDL